MASDRRRYLEHYMQPHVELGSLVRDLATMHGLNVVRCFTEADEQLNGRHQAVVLLTPDPEWSSDEADVGHRG